MSSDKPISNVIQEWAQVFMHRSGHDFRQFMEETGLSFSQVNVLMRLFHGTKCDVSEIGEEMGVTNPAASQAVDRLVQLGLIERTEDPADRRSKRLTLSNKGRVLIENGIKARSQWMIDLAQTLNKEQEQTVISALTILTEMTRKNENHPNLNSRKTK